MKYNGSNALLVFITILISTPTLLHGTATEECHWNAAYFNATYINNYGGDTRVEDFSNDAIRVTNVVIRLDSLLKSRARAGKLMHFIQYELIDDYVKNYGFGQGTLYQSGNVVFIRLTDSMAINRALKELWSIDDYVLSPNISAHAWLFSLHVGLGKTLDKAKGQINNKIDPDRPDWNILWLNVDGEIWSSHYFFQKEKDGFYHVYTGLYVSKTSAHKAQELLEKAYNLKTTITSHYITPAIIKQYATY